MDGPPIDDGAVAVAGDRIEAVGRFEEVRALGGAVTDLGEVVAPARPDQRALPSRFHVVARDDRAAAVVCRLDPSDQRAAPRSFR